MDMVTDIDAYMDTDIGILTWTLTTETELK
jgi:hypothetical protein